MAPIEFTDQEVRELEDEEQRMLRESVTVGIEDVDGYKIYMARVEGSGTYECSEEQYRIIAQYDAVKRRQGEAEVACATARDFDWPEPELAEEDEPAPEAVPPEGKLTARQALFCEGYAAQPVAARAAVLAGYAEENAANQGHRLLKNPLILSRVAALRAERKLRYVVEADTVHDKLEAVFFDALGNGHHAAAVAALRLQAGLARLPTRATADGEAKPATTKRTRGVRQAEKSRGRRRKKPRKADRSR
jgi:phage terminase small subunit